MFLQSRSRITAVLLLVCSLLVSLFQNCGSGAVGKTAKGADGNPRVDPLDTDGPTVSLLAKPASLTNNKTATFQVIVSDDRTGVAKVEYSHNKAPWQQISNMIVLENLGTGSHEVRIKATDNNGNESMIHSHMWKVDVTLPTITINTKPAQLSNMEMFSGKKMILTFSPADDMQVGSVACKVNGAAVGCSSNKIQVEPEVGAFTAQIVVKDKAGNSKSASYYWTVTNKPGQFLAPELTAKPAAYSNEDVVNFKFKGLPASSAVTYACSIDGGTAVDCKPNAVNTFSGIGERKSGGKLIAHVFKVVVTYTGKGSASTTYSWTTDMTKPTVSIAKKPSTLSLTDEPIVHIEGGDNSGASNIVVSCKLDGKTFAGCKINQDFEVPSQAGPHELVVTVSDKAGNAAAAISPIKWTTASCNRNSITLRWPLKGERGKNWSVESYFDRESANGPVEDWGPRNNDKARAIDGNADITLFPGDNKALYTYDTAGNITGHAANAKVVAMESGKITELVENHPDCSLTSGACNTSAVNKITILHDNGFRTNYYHIAKNSVPSSLAVGKMVDKGQLIAYAGSSGVKIPQLRVQYRNCSNVAIDPMGATNGGVTMQVDTPINYASAPALYNVVLHKAALFESTLDAHRVYGLNRKYEYVSGTSMDRKQPLTLSFFADNLTYGENLVVGLQAPGVTSANAYVYDNIAVSGSSANSIGRRFSKQILVGALVKGTWKLHIYHTQSSACRENKSKLQSCLLRTITYSVK